MRSEPKSMKNTLIIESSFWRLY